MTLQPAAGPAASPPRPREKPLRRVLRGLIGGVASRRFALAWGLHVLGLAWLLLHPAATVTTGELKCRGTYISENALLIDSMDAHAGAPEAQRAREHHGAFVRVVPAGGCASDDCAEAAATWLRRRLAAIDRVEAFVQPLGGRRYNVYGILRAAPLADHKEAVVLVTHYRNIAATTTATTTTPSGVGLSLALLELLARSPWLAKDVIVLFADDGPRDGIDGVAPGTDAWLRAYHLDGAVDANDNDDGAAMALPMRAGLIRAAINLETLGDLAGANVLGLLTAGSNGQLPNLDLVNTVVSHARLHDVPVVLDRCETLQQVPIEEDPEGAPGAVHYEGRRCGDLLEATRAAAAALVSQHVPVASRGPVREYLGNLFGMLRFMKTLATGPSGPHANFIRYNIDAVTLSVARGMPEIHEYGARSVQNVLRTLELVVRSMSNLEEKLHQSFFLYVLPNTSTFVSVGEYYYVIVLVLAPAIVHLLTMASQTVGMRVALALVVLAGLEMLALGVLGLARHIPTGLYLPVAVGIAAVELGIALVGVPALRRVPLLAGNQHAAQWYARKGEFDDKAPVEMTHVHQDPGWRALKATMLVLVVYAHCIGGILNYPMALCCAIPMAFFALMAPMHALSGPGKRAFVSAWLVLTSPPVLFTISSLMGPGTREALAYFVQSFHDGTNLLALPYICCLYLPVHALAVTVFGAESESTTIELERKLQ